jgi:hypothetical protein
MSSSAIPDSQNVDFRLTIAYPGAGIPTEHQVWTMSLKRGDRWRVCTTKQA